MKWKNQITDLLTDNITKTYKQSNNNVYNSINLEAKHIAKKLEIADRVECMAEKPAYITLKDHKENFNINPKCHLINPAKSELGKVSKTIVENINKTVREKLHCNQWRNRQMLLIGSKILPTKGIIYLFNLILKSFTLQ